MVVSVMIAPAALSAPAIYEINGSKDERSGTVRVSSDGLTLDTDLGPVDLVAIDRVLHGRPVDLTAAEVAYLFTVLPATLPAARPVAAALDLSPYTVRDRARRGALTATKAA